jgi:hypothetical protein
VLSPSEVLIGVGFDYVCVFIEVSERLRCTVSF